MDSHIGTQLKHAREASGLSLKEIAVRTKIAVTALEAVERNDFSRLPGGIFGRSFVRAYALEVGLDPDAVVVSFVDALEQEAREAAERKAVRPEITADDRRFLERQQRAVRWLRIGVVALVIAAIAFVIWQVRGAVTEDPVGEAGASPSVPTPTSAPTGFAPPPTERIAGLDTGAGAAPGGGGGAGAEADVSAVPGADGAAGPGTAGPVVFEMAFSGDCWISYSVDGGPSVAQLFRAGDRRRIEATRELALDVGNAGALALVIDGRPTRALGAEGARVRRRITRAEVAGMTAE